MRIPTRGFGIALSSVLTAGLAQTAWGQSFDDLVLHTVTPCRVFDTRVSQGGDGPLTSGETRGFAIIASNLSGQGGNPSGCGIPARTPDGVAQTIAIAINIQAVNPTGLGTLKGWAGDIAEPLRGAIVNYQALSPNLNIANEVPLAVRTVGTLGLQDIFIKANGNGTEVAADVVGYYTKSERHVEQNASSPTLTAGFDGNFAEADVAGGTIGGGGSSGAPNSVTASWATVGGGRNNNAGGSSPGQGNWSTVGGGEANGTAANYATIAGGHTNVASGENTTVGGGFNNQAVGTTSTIPGGTGNSTGGANSFAAGTNANANHAGAMLFSDTSAGDFNSAAANEFAVRAAGGFRFATNAAGTTGCTISGGNLVCSGTITPGSDRASKENFTPVDPQQVLERVVALPIERWNYRADGTSVQHIGPMAQDFQAAFAVGHDDKHIATVDADGVAFAAIQALYKQLQQKDAEIRELRSRVNGLQSIADRVERLERQNPVRTVSVEP